jgi:amino acid adenylation domain-containing protein
MSLLAMVNILLHRYTGQEDIIIGSPVAGRDHIDLEDQIGYYANTLAMRARFKGNNSFLDLLEHVKKLTLDAYEHQVYPFDTLVDELQLQRDMSRHALFDVVVVLQNTALDNSLKQQHFDNLTVQQYDAGERLMSKFDIVFNFAEGREELLLDLEYNSDIYNRSTIERLSAHLEQLMAAVIASPGTAIGELDYLSAAEKHRLLYEFNDTDSGYRHDKTIVDLFEEQVSRTPDATAVVYGSVTLSYRQLNEQANQLGDYLRRQYNLGADDLAGILLERTEWQIIAMLGVLKAGGAYMPIDVEYPQERIDFMVTDSGCKLVIDERELNRFREQQPECNRSNLPTAAQAEHLAYVIYTSGTTGTPKGSLIEHRNVVRLLKTDKPLFDFTASDVWTLFHSVCFDFSVWEIYGALLNGGRLVIVSGLTARDPQLFLELLKQEGVTVLNQTPSSFYNLVKQHEEQPVRGLQLRYVIFGGEALSPGRLRAWKARYPSTRLINMYGITETTVHVTYKELGEEELLSNSSNIGRPIPTLRCYVLDGRKQLLPIGVAGELYVGGAGVSRGYLNRAQLTEQRFMADRFRAGERVYRSGDKVKLLENGEMEYVGRIDEQVKIRGYRIELGEIENALRALQLVEDAVVIVSTNDKEEKELIAYLVSREKLQTNLLRQ